MASPGSHTGSKRRSVGNQLSVEDNALDVIAKEADTRDAKSSAFMAEARKLRLDEREKNKKENENEDDDDDNNENVDDGDNKEMNPHAPANNENKSTPKVPINANHSNTNKQNIIESKPMLEHTNSRDSLGDLQDKYKKVLLANAQLDNEKRALTYEVDLLKDEKWDAEENMQQMKRNLQDANREKDRLSSEVKELKSKCQKLTIDLTQRDHLIKTSGLALVTTDNSYSPPDETDYTSGNNMSSAVLTAEHLEILADYTGPLGERLKKLFDERTEILEEKEKLAKELSELKSNTTNMQQQQQFPYMQQNASSSSMASPMFDGVLFDDTHKNYTEMKLKLKKAEQEITTLQGHVTRLETQLTRYKSSSENLERSEEELKAEKRKLQIEIRALNTRVEELQSKNNSLVKRLEKLKNKNLVENN